MSRSGLLAILTKGSSSVPRRIIFDICIHLSKVGFWGFGVLGLLVMVLVLVVVVVVVV